MALMLLAIGVIGVLWPVFAIAGGIWAVYRPIVSAADRAAARLRAESIEHEELAARADEQNRLALAGDLRGVHGMWPPVEPDDVAVRPNRCA